MQARRLLSGFAGQSWSVWVERFSSTGESTPIEETKRAAARTAVIIHREQIDNKCHMGGDVLAYHASYYLTSI